MTSFNPHDYLNSFANYESHLNTINIGDFHLNRILLLLHAVDNPHYKLKIIHVAGTKGKGSTCAFIASICQHAGYKVGLFTSPHLHKVNERIRILTLENIHERDQFPGCISDEDFEHVLAFLRPHIAKLINEEKPLTYFEVLTAAAFVYFQQKNVDIVVLETGLGGRLDATNASDAMISVLTPISLDHMHILGATLEEIAHEKAGIIKHSYQKVVVAPQEMDVMKVIEKRCHEFGIRPIGVVPEQFKDLQTSLKGAHQNINAATALNVISVLRTMGYKISDEAVSEGLKNVRWSGRFEVIRQEPTVVVDCAHNPLSAKALARTIIDVYPFRRIVLILGISEDKDVAKICEHLKDSATEFILTKANHPRGHEFTEKEAQTYFYNKPYQLIPDLKEALNQALVKSNPDDVIVIAGSIFLVGQAMQHLLSGTGSR